MHAKNTHAAPVHVVNRGERGRIDPSTTGEVWEPWDEPIAREFRHLARTIVLVVTRLVALTALVVLVFSGAEAVGMPGIAAGLVVIIALGFVLMPRRSRSLPTR